MNSTYPSDFREMFEAHFARLEAKVEGRFRELRLDHAFRTTLADLRADIAATTTSIIRWYFFFWVTWVAALAALLKL